MNCRYSEDRILNGGKQCLVLEKVAEKQGVSNGKLMEHVSQPLYLQ